VKTVAKARKAPKSAAKVKAGPTAKVAKATKAAKPAAASKPAKKATKKTAKPAARKTPKPAAMSASAAKWGQRADLGAPVEGFFARQPPERRAILEALRAEVTRAAPDAVGSIKWGMPFYTLDGEMMCAIAAHKSHVNLILAGPPGTYADPDGRLEGEGKTGKHLKLRSLAELPLAAVRAWIETAAATARAK
jgi:hypothetical protein